MRRSFSLYVVCFAALLASGCASVAPTYTPAMDNITNMKNSGEFTVKVGDFASAKAPENVNPISIRGGSMISPYGESYARYLAEALKLELDMARKLSPSSETVISGELLKNNIDASGFSTGFGDIAARFVVTKSGQTRYDQVKSAHHEWESSFAGAVAIPKASQSYAELVQKLIAELFRDQTFIQSLK